MRCLRNGVSIDCDPWSNTRLRQDGTRYTTRVSGRSVVDGTVDIELVTETEVENVLILRPLPVFCPVVSSRRCDEFSNSRVLPRTPLSKVDRFDRSNDKYPCSIL